MKPRDLLLLAIVAIVLAQSCGKSADVAVAEARVAAADSSLAVARDSMEALHAARLDDEAAHGARMAALDDSVAAWRARASEARSVAARARQDAQRAADSLVPMLDSVQAAAFDQYRADIEVTMIALEDENATLRAENQALTVTLGESERIRAKLRAEVEVTRDVLAQAEVALAARDAMIEALMDDAEPWWEDALEKGALVYTALDLIGVGR